MNMLVGTGVGAAVVAGGRLLDVEVVLGVAEVLGAVKLEVEGLLGTGSGLRTVGGGTIVEKEGMAVVVEDPYWPPCWIINVVVVVGGVKLMMEMGGNTSSMFAIAFTLLSLTSSTSSVAWPALVDRPSKVTSEFCAMQERLSVLSLARITVPERGMVKLEFASAMSLGMALPRVTLFMLVDPSVATRFVVVQPKEPATAQLDPVNPFVQMHEHTPCDITLVPPFRHARDF